MSAVIFLVCAPRLCFVMSIQSQDIHGGTGTCRLGFVISMIVRSTSSVNVATGDASPSRGCRPMVMARMQSGLHTLQQCTLMQRARRWSITAARSFARMAQFSRFIFVRSLCPQPRHWKIIEFKKNQIGLNLKKINLVD